MDMKVTDAVQATPSAEPTEERLSINMRHWLEEHWEDSGLPQPIWRRLHKIDAAARGAAAVSEILTMDRQASGLADGDAVVYEPLAPILVDRLSDAVNVLINDVLDGLEGLNRYSDEFKAAIEVRNK